MGVTENLRVQISGLKEQLAEKEAMIDWLADKLALASGSMFDGEMEDLGFQCEQECAQTVCTLVCRKEHWINSAQEAVKDA